MFVARNGVFLEKEFLMKETSGRTVQLDEVQDEPTGEDSMSDAIMAERVKEPEAREPPPRRSEML